MIDIQHERERADRGALAQERKLGLPAGLRREREKHSAQRDNQERHHAEAFQPFSTFSMLFGLSV